MEFEGDTCWSVFFSISGKLFHDLGAKVLKAPSPYWVLDLGMTRALCCPWDLNNLVGGVLHDYIPKIFSGFGVMKGCVHLYYGLEHNALVYR